MYLARKYHLGTLFFTFPTGDGTAILHDCPSRARQCNHLQCKGSTFIFKTLSIGPALGIEPATSTRQSSALPTQLILLLLKKKRSAKNLGVKVIVCIP